MTDPVELVFNDPAQILTVDRVVGGMAGDDLFGTLDADARRSTDDRVTVSPGLEVELQSPSQGGTGDSFTVRVSVEYTLKKLTDRDCFHLRQRDPSADMRWRQDDFDSHGSGRPPAHSSLSGSRTPNG